MSSTTGSSQRNVVLQLSTSNRLLIIVTIFLVYTISHGAAIKCWECNSKYDSRCGDPFNNHSVAVVDCDQRSEAVTHLTITGEEPLKATLCRKTMQIVNDEVRVIRGCGWVRNEGYYKDRDCYQKAGTHQIQVFHCACYEDGCNRGVSTGSASILLLLLLPILPAALLRFE